MPSGSDEDTQALCDLSDAVTKPADPGAVHVPEEDRHVAGDHTTDGRTTCSVSGVTHTWHELCRFLYDRQSAESLVSHCVHVQYIQHMSEYIHTADTYGSVLEVNHTPSSG